MIELTEPLIDEILADLWKGAVFDEGCRRILLQLAELAAAAPSGPRAALIEPLLPEITFELATLRNRQLITRAEQEVLRRTVVATFGLSVGSNAAVSWMMTARADVIRLADFDTITPSNLNRLRFGWDAVGRLKSDVTRDEIRRIHPFARVETTSGLDPRAVEIFLDGVPPTDVIIDETDDIVSKRFLRRYARDRRIPVVQAGDMGDSVFIDVERYDRDPQPELFCGRLPGIDEVDFTAVTDLERMRWFIMLCGTEDQSEVLLASAEQLVNPDLSGAPQLGATAAIAGGAVALTVKKIRLGEDVPSGRYWISLDQLLVPDYFAPARRERRRAAAARVRAGFRFPAAPGSSDQHTQGENGQDGSER